MKTRKTVGKKDRMRSEYDFSGGVRGKHHSGYRQGTNLVPIDSDVAAVFPSAAAVNEALRVLAKAAKQQAALAADE